MTTGSRALVWAVGELKAQSVDGAARDARILLAHALGVDRGRLTLILPDAVNAARLAAFRGLIRRRAMREPVSQIIGYRDFFGLRFIVTSDVLDPRPETETLVAAALELPFQDVLDLGTGSGAILLTLLAQRGDATGMGSDVSPPALAVAARNAQVIGVADRMQLRVSDWYCDIGGAFDLIVSNPPYIAEHEMGGLYPELAHEPRVALTDGADGLSAYRVICAGARDHLTSMGWLMVEIGPTQGADVAGLMQRAGLESVEIRTDLDGRDRVVLGRNPAKPPQTG